MFMSWHNVLMVGHTLLGMMLLLSGWKVELSGSNHGFFVVGLAVVFLVELDLFGVLVEQGVLEDR